MFDEIAKAIGYHFWYPKSDGEAIACGSACAADVMKAIEAAQQSEQADGVDEEEWGECPYCYESARLSKFKVPRLS